MQSKVVVSKASPDRVLNDYSSLLDKFGYQKLFKKEDDIVLKLNLSWSLYFPSCSTEPWQLDGVVKKFLDDGYKNLIPVENKTVVTNPLKGSKLNKWDNIFNKYNLKFQPLTDVAWVKYNPKFDMLALDKIFPDGFSIPEMFIGKPVVHLPTMKTHGHTIMTGAMKNAFGGLLRERRHHSHKMIHEVLVDLLSIQKEIHPSIFAVMDGTVCGDGAGPRTMVPVVKDYILCSDDQVAIDAISAKMMGFDPMKIDFIKMAHDRGLGVGDVDQIDIVGEDISNVNFGFTTGKSPVVFWDQMFRKGPLKFLEKLIFHTPLFKVPIFLSGFYHDYIWYNMIGKKRIDEFSKTKWGKLFFSYK
jgi:uncharacterized protein (DUF362 family)